MMNKEGKYRHLLPPSMMYPKAITEHLRVGGV
jgi:hypothetical protein